MVQQSSFSIFPATTELLTFPDLAVKLTPKGPIATYEPTGQGSHYSIQFNLMSLNHWVQFVFMFGYPDEWSGPPPPPGTYVMSYGADIQPTSIWSDGAEYMNTQTAPFGGVFPDTGIDPNRWNAGEYYILLKLGPAQGGGMTVEVEVHRISDDGLVWSTGSTQFPTFTYGPGDSLPSVIGVEATGASGGGATKFLQFDATLEVSSSSPLYGVMTGDAVMWTYNDGTDGTLPLQWNNETEESSNLWTSVISEAPNTKALELSLTQGSQVFNNPPLSSPARLTNAAAPTKTKLGGYDAISTSWTNPTSSPIPAIIFNVVTNGLGQPAALVTASATFPPGATTEVSGVLLNSPPSGTYKVTSFAISPDNRPLSNKVEASVDF